MERQYPPVLREYTEEMWTDAKAAMEYQREHGSYLFVALTIYDAAIQDGGRFTCEYLVKDWRLDQKDAICSRSRSKRPGGRAAGPISERELSDVPDLDERAEAEYLTQAIDSTTPWAELPEWMRESWRCEVDESRDPELIRQAKERDG